MTDTNQAVTALEPTAVWRFFADISAVPRPSKQEEKIRAHVRETAQKLGLAFREDKTGNIVIDVPASPGHEKAPLTILQGHLDMVCEKNAGTTHDFDRDPIRLIVEKDAASDEQIVRAAGTTLGADNGIGLALALAAVTDPNVVHGPLEILCTVDEEMGMTGAGVLTPEFVRGRRLLNLDSEDDAILYIGCAGGGDISLTWELPAAAPAKGLEGVQITVSGLRGGHSGGDIHENRGNAVKALVRTLSAAGLDGLQIAALRGGSKRNALAREATAVLAGPAGTLDKLRKAAGPMQEIVAHESAEPGATITVEPAGADAIGHVLSAADTQRILWTITGLPHGVLEMHPKVPGLVQTSNNVATLSTEPAAGGAKMTIVIGCLSRSSVDGRLEVTREQIAAIGRLAGAAVEFGHSYPGWAPDIDSPLLASCRRVFTELFGSEPNVTAIHAGLECGIIGQRLGKVDMISFGPRITGAHSPDERVYVASVQRSYQFLTKVLAELA
ncbi:MAG: aminoacyl-histidine dipeptidase [Phycisphaerae bacterium]|jgi:dipeptidase D